MVRSVVSALVALALIVGGGIAERIFIENSFSSLEEAFTELGEDIEREVCTREKAEKALEKWLDEKEKLHAFIPHSEIKELDLWISETVGLVEKKDYKEAFVKNQVTLNLLKEIPKTFSIRFANLF